MAAPQKEIRFRLPAEVWWRWAAHARAAGYALPIWIRLKVDGLLPGDKPAPVQGEVAPPLRDRLLAAIGEDGIKKSEVPALARRMGVPARSVHASLGSMVASKRMVRIGDEYRRV